MPESGAVVLDTDVASLIIKGRGQPLAPQLAGRTWCVSFVTVGELVTWAELQGWGLRKWTALADWLGSVVVLPYSVDVAYTWGQLAAAARRRGRPRPANDMWVAACCIAEGTPLATRNVKDFADFVEHHGLRLALDWAGVDGSAPFAGPWLRRRTFESASRVLSSASGSVCRYPPSRGRRPRPATGRAAPTWARAPSLTRFQHRGIDNTRPLRRRECPAERILVFGDLRVGLVADLVRLLHVRLSNSGTPAISPACFWISRRRRPRAGPATSW